MSACDDLKELGIEVQACKTPVLTFQEADEPVQVLVAQGYVQPISIQHQDEEQTNLWPYVYGATVLLFLAGMFYCKRHSILGVVKRIRFLLELRTARITRQESANANAVFPFDVKELKLDPNIEAIESAIPVDSVVIDIPESN